MAKDKITVERLIYCSGPNWEGNGSIESSTCQFGESMKTTTNRYRCSYCSTGQTPEGIYASAAGVKKQESKKALAPKGPPEEEDIEFSEIMEESKAVEMVAPTEEITEMEPVQVAATSEDPETVEVSKKKAPRRTRKRRRF